MRKPKRKFLFENKWTRERIVIDCNVDGNSDLMIACGNYAIYFSVDQIGVLKEHIEVVEKYFKSKGILK